MKTIRNQVKCPKGSRLSMSLMKSFKSCPYSTFYAAKRNNKKQQTKIQLKLARKRCQSRKATFWPSRYVRLGLLQTPSFSMWPSLMRLGNK